MPERENRIEFPSCPHKQPQEQERLAVREIGVTLGLPTRTRAWRDGERFKLEGFAWKRKRSSTQGLTVPLRSPPNEMEFSGERSESAATTG